MGIVTAMPAEAKTLNGLVRSAQCWPRIVCAGVGPTAASAAALRLVDEGADVLVSWGVAGSLEDGLRVGAIVIYSKVLDVGSGIEYPCDCRWVAVLSDRLNALGAIQRAALAVGHPVTSAKEKTALHARYQCAVVDMESGAVAAVAQARQIAFAGIRVVLDTSVSSIPSVASGSLTDPSDRRRRMMVSLCRRPWELGGLIRLGLHYLTALARLRQASSRLLFDTNQTSNAKAA